MRAAHRYGLRTIALTDHDTTAGWAEAAEATSSLGMTLLPASCRLPGHRVLGTAEGFAEMTDFELALYYRDDAPASTATLAERLAAYCHLEP